MDDYMFAQVMREKKHLKPLLEHILVMKIADIKFTIGFNANEKKDADGKVTGYNVKFTANNGIQVSADNKLSLSVVNQKGTELPATGGIGTVIFYVLGTILLIGCGIVLVSKRRMTKEK